MARLGVSADRSMSLVAKLVVTFGCFVVPTVMMRLGGQAGCGCGYLMAMYCCGALLLTWFWH
jgi:hypothetical protein